MQMPSAMNFKFRNAFNKFNRKKFVVVLRECLGRRERAKW